MGVARPQGPSTHADSGRRGYETSSNEIAGLAAAGGPAADDSPPACAQGLRRRSHPVARVKQLERLEREVTLGRQNTWDLHNRLCPTLRETAAGRLQARCGVDLERQPGRTAALVGPDAWELIRHDRAAPERRHDPGVSAGSLDRALAALEQL